MGLAAALVYPATLAILNNVFTESEVLGLVVAGLSNRAIASRLVIGDETVKSHTRAIYRKLRVSDRAGAVAAALREGLFR